MGDITRLAGHWGEDGEYTGSQDRTQGHTQTSSTLSRSCKGNLETLINLNTHVLEAFVLICSDHCFPRSYVIQEASSVLISPSAWQNWRKRTSPANFNSKPPWMFLDCGRNPESPENRREHASSPLRGLQSDRELNLWLMYCHAKNLVSRSFVQISSS